MSVIFCAMAGAAQLCDYLKEKSEMKKEQMRKEAIKMYSEKGVSPFELSKSDIMKDWKGDRTLFPSELVPYFTKNPIALNDYTEAIRLDTKSGKPDSYIFVNKPFLTLFYEHYKRKIKVYNNTGVLYY